LDCLIGQTILLSLVLRPGCSQHQHCREAVPPAPAPQALQRRRPEHGGPLRLPAALRSRLCAARLEQHHFLSNLWRYLAVDVVEASFGQLRAAVATAPDFSAADAAHRRCVASLVSQARPPARHLSLARQ
jgi:hypothetical protein